MHTEPFVVIDNLLSKTDLEKIQQSLNNRNMPFYWHNDIDYEEKTPDLFNFGFSHQLLSSSKKERSEFLLEYLPIVTETCSTLSLNLIELLRMRIVLLTNVGHIHANRQHVDLPQTPCTTLVYYPEETDGNFVVCLDNHDKQIKPKENRCIVMYDNIGHHGHNPLTNRRRVVVNANIIVQ